MEKAKAIFYANIILENSEDPKKLWKSINNNTKLQSSFKPQFYIKDIGESCRIPPTFPHGIKFDIQ